MRKIILALLILASFYALNMWASSPLNPTDAIALEEATQTNGEASFTGGALILLSVVIGYFSKKLYVYRSLNQD